MDVCVLDVGGEKGTTSKERGQNYEGFIAQERFQRKDLHGQYTVACPVRDDSSVYVPPRKGINPSLQRFERRVLSKRVVAPPAASESESKVRV